jgi:glucose-6-phosphate 1-epimerase
MTAHAPASAARLVTGKGGLPMIAVTTPAASAEIYLQGAHVTSWHPRHTESDVLWMSDHSRFEHGRPIRGGIPVCFPWFGVAAQNPVAPQHGFARIVQWTYLGARPEGDAMTCSFRLKQSAAASARHWSHPFEATYSVTVGRELTLRLDVTNTGTIPFAFEEMLHTYFAVQDTGSTMVDGLREVAFTAKGDPSVRRDPAPVLVGDGISRTYRGVSDPVTIDDGHRRISIMATSGHDAVLWNPGPSIAASFEDFPDDDWSNMLCFESGNVGAAAPLLQPGDNHALVVALSVDIA